MRTTLQQNYSPGISQRRCGFHRKAHQRIIGKLSVLNKESGYFTDIAVLCCRAMLAMDRLLRDLHMKVVPVIDVIPSVTYDQLQSLREAFHQFIYVFPSARLDFFVVF